MKVPRMGAKAFEQCAGFLRIPQSKNPLDNSAVHPESYPVVEHIAKDLHCTVDDLIKNKELRTKLILKVCLRYSRTAYTNGYHARTR